MTTSNIIINHGESNIEFLYMAYGQQFDVCIAHIKGDNVLRPYAVVRCPNVDDMTWSHAIRYCGTWEDAKNEFWEYMEYMNNRD